MSLRDFFILFRVIGGLHFFISPMVMAITMSTMVVAVSMVAMAMFFVLRYFVLSVFVVLVFLDILFLWVLIFNAFTFISTFILALFPLVKACQAFLFYEVSRACIASISLSVSRSGFSPRRFMLMISNACVVVSVTRLAARCLSVE